MDIGEIREGNEALFRRWIDDIWNKGSEQTIDELVSENVVVNYQFHIDKKPIIGREGYKEFVRFFRGIFAEIRVTIEDVVADENKVVALCNLKLTRREENDSPPPSEPLTRSGLCQVIIENDKIIQIWSNIDLFVLLN